MLHFSSGSSKTPGFEEITLSPCFSMLFLHAFFFGHSSETLRNPLSLKELSHILWEIFLTTSKNATYYGEKWGKVGFSGKSIRGVVLVPGCQQAQLGCKGTSGCANPLSGTAEGVLWFPVGHHRGYGSLSSDLSSPGMGKI
jgi:hypothetical protein